MLRNAVGVSPFLKKSVAKVCIDDTETKEGSRSRPNPMQAPKGASRRNRTSRDKPV